MAETKSKRRWFRYSLRTFLIGVTVICIWLGFKVNAANKQREAVAAARVLGGIVSYDFDKNDSDVDRHPSEPAWLIKLLGVDFFHDVVEVAFRRTPADFSLGNFYPQLRGLPRLHSLVFSGVAVSDDDFRYLADVKLEWLWLRGNGITGVGFKYLANSNISWLMIEENPITDAGVDQIERFVGLRELYLSNSRVTDASIESLAKLPKLRLIDISGTPVTDDGVRRLKQLRPNLKIR
jgi:hypothetical protein